MIFLAPLVWPELSGRKMKNYKMPNFMKIGLKIKITKNYFWTNYNFWLLNSIPKMIFLSEKMAGQSLVIFNKDYIAKNSKIGIILPKMKILKKQKETIFCTHWVDNVVKFLGLNLVWCGLGETRIFQKNSKIGIIFPKMKISKKQKNRFLYSLSG